MSEMGLVGKNGKEKGRKAGEAGRYGGEENRKNVS